LIGSTSHFRTLEGFQIIKTYFPELNEQQFVRLESLGELYQEWNSKINLVSRKDIELLFERHVLHSLAIAKFIRFKPGSHVMDVGTGGGFPGIPLSICFPEVRFTLVDSIGKKTAVVADIANRTGLDNVEVITTRAEQIRGQFDFVVSRATAPLADLYRWTSKSISKKQYHAIPNGIICLKGGDLREELLPFKSRVEVVPISQYFREEFFETKKLVFLPC
jgi:16S rRNA (guanine527-N7)-methyltransferase